MSDTQKQPAAGIRLASAGAEAAVLDFASVVAEYEGPLLRYASHLSGKGVDAEDVVQETFLRLHRQCQRKGIGSIRNLSTWLFRVAHNLATDTLRKRKRHKAAQEKLTEQAREQEETGDQFAALGDLERREAVEQATRQLAKLPEAQRRVLMLKLVKGLSIRQIAQVVGCSPGSVGYQMNQGLSQLSRQLRKRGII